MTTGGRRNTSPLELAIMTAARSLAFTLPPGALLLIVGPASEPRLLTVFLTHLTALVVIGLALAAVLFPASGERWFGAGDGVGERLGTAATAVSLVTGVVALTSLATSAALRYTPSLQFLQLLSALDISWVTAATVIGVGWWKGRYAGLAAGSVVGVLCVWSIWMYLANVGFAPDGGWLLDGAALLRYVIPFDVAASFAAFGAVAVGARAQVAGSH